MIKILLFAVVAALLIWIFLRLNQARPNSRAADPQLPEPEPDGEYHAVSIRFAENACFAVKRRAGERYLASDPPELPLKDCDAPRCECYFAHHKDRRSGHDRRSPYDPAIGSSGTGVHEIERRQSGGRREND